MYLIGLTKSGMMTQKSKRKPLKSLKRVAALNRTPEHQKYSAGSRSFLGQVFPTGVVVFMDSILLNTLATGNPYLYTGVNFRQSDWFINDLVCTLSNFIPVISTLRSCIDNKISLTTKLTGDKRTLSFTNNTST